MKTNCKDCIHYERCTVVHCFEFGKYKIEVDHLLGEHWSNNPDDLSLKKIPVVEVTMKNCHGFSHKDPEAYIALLSKENTTRTRKISI